MNKNQVLESIRSHPTKKELLKEKQAELIKLINEREQGVGSLPCSLGKTDGGGSGISDTTYRKAEKAIRYDPEIESLRRRVDELKGEVDRVDKALAQLEPIAKTILEMREMPKYDEKRMQWERTLRWGDISRAINYSAKQCQRIYETTINQITEMMS